MMRLLVLPAILSIAALTVPAVVPAAPITLSGTITYDGPYDGDSLYVAVLDTANGDSRLLDLQAIDVGNSPLSVPYAFDLDNATLPDQVWVAGFLDVDGGGIAADISAADVLGWYASAPVATPVSTAASLGGIDFSLPTGEIHGTVSFGVGQEGAEISTRPFALCGDGWVMNRPIVTVLTPGPYAIIGIYAGSWCLQAYGFGTGTWPPVICYGDPTCVDPAPVDVAEGEVVSGVSLSFAGPVPSQGITWGRLKARYP